MLPAALAFAAGLVVHPADLAPVPTAIPAPTPAPTASAPAIAPTSPSTMPPEPPAPSIYEVHLAVDLPIAIVGGAFGLGRELFKNELTRQSCPCDPSTLNPIDRGTVGNHNHLASVVADVTAYGVPGLLPLLDLADLGAHRAFAEDLLVYAETIAVDTAIQNTANFVFARPRPRTYAGDPAYLHAAEGYLSFYAGHVATVFAGFSAASYTIRRRHGEKIWPWLLTVFAGGSVAVERVASGHHFPTDVAVAAVAGTAVGIAVPWLHLRSRRARVALGPLAVAQGRGLGLAGAF